MRTPSDWRGRWRILETEQWDADYLDMDGPAHVAFEGDGLGQVQFGMVRGDLDCRYSTRDGRPFVEFTWQGFDEDEPICGRGWAHQQPNGHVQGRIFLHRGDDSSFTASREATLGKPRRKLGR
jgi:hypothetical protein